MHVVFCYHNCFFCYLYNYFGFCIFPSQYCAYLFRQERLKFWSDPDTELKLAKETGISVFRMGIDWTRVMPKEPTDAEFKSSVSLRNLLCTSYAFSWNIYILSSLCSVYSFCIGGITDPSPFLGQFCST